MMAEAAEQKDISRTALGYVAMASARVAYPAQVADVADSSFFPDQPNTIEGAAAERRPDACSAAMRQADTPSSIP